MAETTSDEQGRRRESGSQVTAAEVIDEAAPLLQDGTQTPLYRTISQRSQAQDFQSHNTIDDRITSSEQKKPTGGVYATISLLLVGVFISQTDQSLVLATYPTVASSFHALDLGSWMLSSFIIAQCVSQPLYGKLSDIYGRKACLQTAYVLFLIGTAGTGLAQSMGQVIAARAIQGAGSSGMLSMVSIIITDLVPIGEVASLRSYVNVLQTTGRSFGGVIGGLLTQALSWRWAFLIQVPPTLLAILLVQWRLEMPTKGPQDESKWQKLKRVDFIGSFFLCVTIFTGCFVLDTAGQKYPWTSTLIITMCIIFFVSLILFIVSAHYVREPIFPLRLITQYAVWTNYLLATLQLLVQVSLMMMVPVYFQITNKASTAAAGAYLIPAFIGNTIGGLLSGYWIKRTGMYKLPSCLAPVLSLLCMVLCLTTWNGHTGPVSSFAIFPGGMAAGMISNSAYVGLAAGVAEEDVAVAGSGIYLAFNLGAIIGASAGFAVWQTTVQEGLKGAVRGLPDGKGIIERALEDIKYVQNASEEIRRRIVPVFIDGFHNCNILYIACAGLCLLVAVFSQQKRLSE